MAEAEAGEILIRSDGSQTVKAANTNRLAGKRIVVTRSVEQGTELAARLAAEGATTIVVPVLRIVALDDLSPLHKALERLAEYHWVIFTSVNGVRIFFAELSKRAPGGSWPDGVRVAAVGPVTAAALDAHGVKAIEVPQRFDGAALAAELGTKEELAGLRILMPRAEIADGELPARFSTMGAEVYEIPIYRTLPTPIGAEQARALVDGCDAITFASSSAVRYFLDGLAARPELEAALRRAVIACIGPKTAATAVERGWLATVVAREATSASLVDSLKACFEHFHAGTR